MLRRNLILDVSPRIPVGTALQQEAAECSDDEIFYLNLQDSLREEFAEIILTMFGAEPYPLRSFGLSHERGADTKFFLFKQGSLLIRSSIKEQEEDRTEWKIDLFLLIYK